MAEEKKDQPVNIQERLTRFEHWVNENQKIISIITGALVVIIGGYFAFTKLYLGPKNQEAQEEMFTAQQYFSKDSLDLAMNGDGTHLGFQQIIDDYKWTEAANLAHYYAGIISLKQEKFDDAIDHLKDFNGKDKMVTNMAYGALGDAYSEKGNMDEAVSYYKKAAYHFENELTTPLFLKRAAMLLESQKKYDEAKSLYEEVKNKYPNSDAGREMDKYIARVDALLGK